MARWQLICGNAFVEGIYSDFQSDAEAARYAADYEARCYRIDPDGTRTLIYEPGQDERQTI